MPKKSAIPKTDGKSYVGARIPNEIKARLHKKSRRERRSVSAEIELALITWTATEV